MAERENNMTREEAIKRIEELYSSVFRDHEDKDTVLEEIRKQCRQAVDMAIDALSADTVPREHFDTLEENYNMISMLLKEEHEKAVGKIEPSISFMTGQTYGKSANFADNSVTKSSNDAIKPNNDVIEHSTTNEEKIADCDLISRAEVLDLIREYFVAKTDELPFHTEDGYEVYDDSAKANDMLIYNKEIRNKVRALPSVSSERVVRCKDCEWKYVKGNTTNYYWCIENECPVDDNDFCSRAKMKGGTE